MLLGAYMFSDEFVSGGVRIALGVSALSELAFWFAPF